jgi:hypothetical protein
MKYVTASDASLRYTGRIDFSDPGAPTFIYAGSSIRVRFTGTSVAVRIRNLYHDCESSIGFMIDGTEGKSILKKDADIHDLALGSGLKTEWHDLVIWKRVAGGNHYFDFFGLILDDGAEVAPFGARPLRRIECYGDSVSAGEVCELPDYVGKADPEGHDGKFSNSWYSYAMMTARNLGAEIHNIAQGGIAVLDGTGYFAGGTVGLVSTWDKLRYNPEIDACTGWDFSKWQPHAVVMALGQNDNHPVDFIDADPERRKIWKDSYAGIIVSLREKYPKALFVVITTLLNHGSGWDTALDEMVSGIVADTSDARVVRYRFTRNGRGTPGHLRVAEHAEMADELTAFIESFGDSVWL